MAARSIASLSISFGLVSIPIKLYSATETSTAIQFKLLGSDGSRLRQQYVSDAPAPAPAPESQLPISPAAVPFRPQIVGKDVAAAPPAKLSASSKTSKSELTEPVNAVEDVPRALASSGPQIVERSEMLKGYEFEKGKFVTFTAEELKALQEGARETIDIVSFIPERSVDPIYFDKAYYLAPDKRGGKPYSLLLEAMRTTGRCALAKWAFRSKEYVVQIRPTAGGLILQQLLYADEVRMIADLGIDLVVVGEAELKLAQQLIEQISADGYEPGLFVDEEKKRILAAVEGKIAGQQVVAPAHHTEPFGAQVIDLVAALRASLTKPVVNETAIAADDVAAGDLKQRKPVRRSNKAEGSTKTSVRKTAS